MRCNLAVRARIRYAPFTAHLDSRARSTRRCSTDVFLLLVYFLPARFKVYKTDKYM